jgi:AraC-like DNA-binding protein
MSRKAYSIDLSDAGWRLVAILISPKKTRGCHRQVKVREIVISRAAMKKILVIEMDLEADDYLTKPSTAEELLREIAARLEKQAALRQGCAIEFQQAPTPRPAETAKLAAFQSLFPAYPQLKEVFHFIETNYHQPIGLSDVAKAVGYSPAYLTNLVRCQTGQTVNRWIVERRMAAARSLLLESDRSVEQIATAVGYQNVGHFFRQFHQLYGMPPKAWKKLNSSYVNSSHTVGSINLYIGGFDEDGTAHDYLAATKSSKDKREMIER